jgi:hypothetical protein
MATITNILCPLCKTTRRVSSDKPINWMCAPKCGHTQVAIQGDMMLIRVGKDTTHVPITSA